MSVSLAAHRTGRLRARATADVVWAGWAAVTMLVGGLVLAPCASAGLGQPALVSRASGVKGSKGDRDSYAPSVSADARFVAFSSNARNLSSADLDSTSDVFVRDRRTGVTSLISRASGLTGAPANDDSFDPSISADGRYVAFDSRANQLSGVQRDSTPDVFVRDRRTHTTTLVSRTGGANGAKGDYTSEEPSISSDGRFVAFTSKATNLGGRGGTDVYVRDLRRGSTTLASRATGVNGAKGDAGSVSASISADGRVVAFSSLAGNLSGADRDDEPNVFVRNLRMHTTTLVSFPRREEAGFASLSISPDGRMVAFSSDANVSDVNPRHDIQIFVRNLRTGAVTLVSRTSGPHGRPAKGGGGTFEPSSSSNGRFVVFSSYAANLSRADGDEKADVFVHDLRTKRTSLLSRPSQHNGAKGDIGSLEPVISGDGRFVAFDSSATNLTRDDNDRARDVYVRAFGPT